MWIGNVQPANPNPDLNRHQMEIRIRIGIQTADPQHSNGKNRDKS
jgi:hypothetical protein